MTPKIINLPKVNDERGNLSFFQNKAHIPFDIKRVYWIYDVPGGELRGGHAYKELQEVIVALSGSFDVVLHDGVQEHKYTLNRSYYGLYVPQMYWRHLENFSTNAVCLVVASDEYNATDYIRDFTLFNSMIDEQTAHGF